MDDLIKDEVKKIIIKFATKKYDKKGKTILLIFDSKQLNNVSYAIGEELSLSKASRGFQHPKPKLDFFREHIALCNKHLLKDRHDWIDKPFIELARRKLKYSPRTFWQDIWHPLSSAYKNCKEHKLV